MNKLALGVVIGLLVGIVANPLMPPAFFVVGGVLLWYLTRPAPPRPEPGPDDRQEPRG